MDTYPLSPVDYIFTGAGSQPISFAFFYPQKLNPNKMKKSLDKTLNYFPLLQSRLIRSSEIDYEFHPTETGLIFEVLESRTRFQESFSIEHYVNPVQTEAGNPLTRIILTQVPGGSVLAASISHALVDGFSYFHFLSSWARLSRGERILLPTMFRQGLWPSFQQAEKKVSPEDIYSIGGIFLNGKRPDSNGRKIHQERIYLSRDSVSGFLQEARRTVPDQPLSENDITMAWLWKKYLPGWTTPEQNPLTHITCPFDFRRVYKPMPATYFGCALCFATASLDYSLLLEKSVVELAGLIKKSIRRMNDIHILKFMNMLEQLRRQKGLEVLEKIHLRHPEQGIIVTNLTRMPVKDLDFGSGPAESFLVHTDVLRSAAIFPAENGLEILVSHPFTDDSTPESDRENNLDFTMI